MFEQKQNKHRQKNPKKQDPVFYHFLWKSVDESGEELKLFFLGSWRAESHGYQLIKRLQTSCFRDFLFIAYNQNYTFIKGSEAFKGTSFWGFHSLFFILSFASASYPSHHQTPAADSFLQITIWVQRMSVETLWGILHQPMSLTN